MSELLRQPVGDVSLPLAQIAGRRGGFNIPRQLDGVTIEWVVLNGGANDLRGGAIASEQPHLSGPY